MSNFSENQTVYLADGREAVYVLKNGDCHLVRVVLEVDEGCGEPPYTYPSEKITSATSVYASPPVEVWDKQVLSKRLLIRELDKELGAKRAEIVLAERNKNEMVNASAKYPCIRDALDFIEGRITHVVQFSGYGAATIHTLTEAFEQVDIWGGRSKHAGIKLLNLFGTDEKGRCTAWGLNQYRDGSGSTKQVWPARSEDEARAKVLELMCAALEAFRAGGGKLMVGQIDIQQTLDKNPWMEVPSDWAAYIEGEKENARKKRIAKLRAELAELEA